MSLAEQRQRTLDALTDAPLDVLVIGGGIVGSGVARDAAMRGLKVGLVEQGDFASGTSSRTSRLLHGGLRYLAQGRLRLVREASVEKRIIHRIAPHLAEPLPFVFPTYRGNRNWRLWQLKIGVKIYDLLCGGRNFGKSTWLKVQDAERKVPGLASAGLTGAVRYYDGFTNDARLTLDTLRSASRHGAALLNYCRFVNAQREAHWACEVKELLGGTTHRIRAHAIVNATGPWAGGLPHSHVKLRLTKGIHVVVDRKRLPVAETVVMTEQKRILFAIPWGDRTILGTTDTDYNGPPEHVAANTGDIEYVLRNANQFFPHARLVPGDVVSTWAGLRPLLADPGGRPSDISRSHEIRNPEPGWWDVAGGKLTTYRLMAEQTVDRVIKSLRKSPAWIGTPQPCRTAHELLLSEEEASVFDGVRPPEFCQEAVEHYCASEWAVHLQDVMLRRTGWRHYLPDVEAKAAQVADWMAQIHGWSGARRDEEIRNFRAETALAPDAASSTPANSLA